MTSIVKKILAIPEVFIGHKVSEEAIHIAEEKLKLNFAKDYREYLSEIGVVALCGHELTGLTNSPRVNVVDVTQLERKVNTALPLNWYVIEQANIDGIVLWQSEDGLIYQTEPGGSPQKVCTNLSEYIDACSDC